MSKTIKFSIQAEPTPFPMEPVLGGYVVTLSGGSVTPQTITGTDGEFTGILPGNYSISVQTVDSNNLPVGQPVQSAEFTVPAETLNIGAASGITVSVE